MSKQKIARLAAAIYEQKLELSVIIYKTKILWIISRNKSDDYCVGPTFNCAVYERQISQSDVLLVKRNARENRRWKRSQRSRNFTRSFRQSSKCFASVS